KTPQRSVILRPQPKNPPAKPALPNFCLGVGNPPARPCPGVGNAKESPCPIKPHPTKPGAGATPAAAASPLKKPTMVPASSAAPPPAKSASSPPSCAV